MHDWSDDNHECMIHMLQCLHFKDNRTVLSVVGLMDRIVIQKDKIHKDMIVQVKGYHGQLDTGKDATEYNWRSK
jgi:hypothetical protein